MELQSNLSKPLEIHITPDANRDLADIMMHIAKDSRTAAHRVRERILERIGELAVAPGRGKISQIPTLKERGVRFTSEGRYLIFYQAKEQEVHVHHIFHSARNISAYDFDFHEQEQTN